MSVKTVKWARIPVWVLGSLPKLAKLTRGMSAIQRARFVDKLVVENRKAFEP